MKVFFKALGILTLAVMSQNAFAAQCGDLNGDGKVTIRDAQKVLAHVEGGEKLKSEEAHLADVNSDGKVDKTDIELFKRFMANGTPLKCPPPPRSRGGRLPGFL
jgi:hypothetical protein